VSFDTSRGLQEHTKGARHKAICREPPYRCHCLRGQRVARFLRNKSPILEGLFCNRDQAICREATRRCATVATGERGWRAFLVVALHAKRLWVAFEVPAVFSLIGLFCKYVQLSTE